MHILLTLCVFICSFVCSSLFFILTLHYVFSLFLTGSRVVTAATSVVFHSTLCLRMHKMSPSKSIGEINNVQSKDANSLRDFVVFFHNLWACPLQIVACVGLLVYMLGAAGLVSAVLLGCMVPIERAIGHRARAARKAVTRLSDERMKAINEMIDGIWTIKLTNLVSAWHGFLIEMVNKVITRSASLVITLLTFMFYSIMPGATPLTSDRAFASLALISVRSHSLNTNTSFQILTHSLNTKTTFQILIHPLNTNVSSHNS